MGIRSRDGARLVLGARGGGADLVYLRRRMPGDVEGVLIGGFRGFEGLCQVVRGAWRHALVRACTAAYFTHLVKTRVIRN